MFFVACETTYALPANSRSSLSNFLHIFSILCKHSSVNYGGFYPLQPQKWNDSMSLTGVQSKSRATPTCLLYDCMSFTKCNSIPILCSVCGMCDVHKSVVWQITRILHTNFPFWIIFVFKVVLQKFCVRLWTGFICLRINSCGGILCTW
jgi:hypothetical protein